MLKADGSPPPSPSEDEGNPYLDVPAQRDYSDGHVPDFPEVLSLFINPDYINNPLDHIYGTQGIQTIGRVTNIPNPNLIERAKDSCPFEPTTAEITNEGYQNSCLEGIVTYPVGCSVLVCVCEGNTYAGRCPLEMLKTRMTMGVDPNE